MGDLLESATRCPHCRAAVRPGAPWCTLCHADLRPAPPVVAPPPVVDRPAAPPAAGPGAAPAGLDPLTAPAEALGLPARGASPTAEPTWPCVTCGSANLLTASVCAACGAGFLAGLREAEGPLLELPVVGDLTRLPRAQRLGLALAIVLVLLALLVGIGLLSG